MTERGYATESDAGMAPPGVVVQDVSRPESPATEIPVTDTLSVRPTRGGVAYPFRLKVEGDDRDVNASTLTLQSVNVESPRANGFEHGSAGFFPGGVEDSVEKETVNDIEKEEEKEKEKEVDMAVEAGAAQERPGVDRFFTAGPGELMAKNDATSTTEAAELQKAERPGMERYETALEDLSTIATGAKP
jgi:hypothetical protein